MKRILSLLLVLVLLMSSVLLVACDKSSDEPAVTTVATTEEEEQGGNGGGGASSTPVEVDKVAGKTASELYAQFLEEYKAADTMDVAIDASMYDDYDDTTGIVNYVFKIGAESGYIKMERSYGEEKYLVEYWLYEGMLYGNVNGDKMKQPVAEAGGFSLHDMAYETVDSLFEIEDMDAYYASLDEAQLYSLRGSYYLERTLSEDEADWFDLDVETAKEKITFNAQGKLTKKEIGDDKSNIALDFYSYGEVVKVSGPANPEEFETYIEGGNGGGNRPEAEDLYEVYETVFNVIDSAYVYSLRVVTDDESMEYTVDKDGDEYVYMASEDIYSLWHIGNYVYVSSGDEAPVAAEANESTLSAFTAMQMQKTVMSGLRLDAEHIPGISVEELDDRTALYVTEASEGGMMYYYNVIFSHDFSSVQIIMTYEHNGEEVMSMNYILDNIGNEYLDVVAPV